MVVSRGATGIDYSAGLVGQLLCNDSVAISCLIFKDSFKYFIVGNSVFVVYLVICLGLLIYIIFFHRVKEFVLLAYEFVHPSLKGSRNLSQQLHIPFLRICCLVRYIL